jgi:hypothetical protein
LARASAALGRHWRESLHLRAARLNLFFDEGSAARDISRFCFFYLTPLFLLVFGVALVGFGVSGSC